MKRIHHTWILGLCLAAPLAMAMSTADSAICTPNAALWHGNTIQIPKGPQQLFGFNNQSTQSTTLMFVNKTGSAQAGWDTKLGPNRWAVLALYGKSLTFSCMQNNKTVPCQNVIKLCQFRRAEFDISSKGSYWVTENTQPDNLIESIAKRHIDADG